MDQIIDNLQLKFHNIKTIYSDVDALLKEIEMKVGKIKIIYSDFMKNNQNKDSFVFGLDSLFFQYKFFQKELDHLLEFKKLISNRIYCEYFKLSYLISTFMKEIEVTEKINVDFEKEFPVYKDLEPNKEYEFELISKLNDYNLNLINNLIIHFKNKNKTLKDHEIQNAFGINIDNFVISFSYNNNLLKEKILVFEKYILFYYQLHEKLFTRYLTKSKLLYGQMIHDIKFDDKKNDNTEKKQAKFLKSIRRDSGVDPEILKNIQDSIDVHHYSDDELSNSSSGELPSPTSELYQQTHIPLKEEYYDMEKEDNNIPREIEIESSSTTLNNTNLFMTIESMDEAKTNIQCDSCKKICENCKCDPIPIPSPPPSEGNSIKSQPIKNPIIDESFTNLDNESVHSNSNTSIKSNTSGKSNNSGNGPWQTIKKRKNRNKNKKSN